MVGATEDIRLHGQTHPGARPDGVIDHQTRAMTTTLEACSVYANSSLCSTQDMALPTKLGSLDTEVEQRRLRERGLYS